MLDIFVNPQMTTLVSIGEILPSYTDRLVVIDDDLKYSHKPELEYHNKYLENLNKTGDGLIKLNVQQVVFPTLLDNIIQNEILLPKGTHAIQILIKSVLSNFS